MLTPRFVLEQNDEYVLLKIGLPYVKVSASEITIESPCLLFYCRPYLLRLELTGPVEDEENKKFRAVYDPDESHGTMTLYIVKKNKGEKFKDLDLISKLMTPSSTNDNMNDSNNDKELELKPKIEVIREILDESVDDENDEEEDIMFCYPCKEQKKDEEDFMFCYPCKEQNIDNKKKTNNNTDLIPTATPDTITLGKPKYGFNNNFSEVLNNLREEFGGLLELTDPDNTPAIVRRGLREQSEDKMWDEDRYQNDFLATNPDNPDPLYDTALNWDAPWNEQYAKVSNDNTISAEDSFDLCGGWSEDDLNDMRSPIMRRKPLPLSNIEEHAATLLTADILFTYCYDQRFTQGEGNVESALAITRLSPALSWLDTYQPSNNSWVVEKSAEYSLTRALMRRSLLHTYLRSYTLGRLALAGVIKIMLLGRNTVLKALLSVRRSLGRGQGQGHYLLNKLFLDDLCVWIQHVETKNSSNNGGIVSQKTNILESTARRLLAAKNALKKEHLNFGDLEFLEEQAVMLSIQDNDNDDEEENDSNSSEESSESDSDDESDNNSDDNNEPATEAEDDNDHDDDDDDDVDVVKPIDVKFKKDGEKNVLIEELTTVFKKL